jgi:hypothetical protein
MEMAKNYDISPLEKRDLYLIIKPIYLPRRKLTILSQLTLYFLLITLLSFSPQKNCFFIKSHFIPFNSPIFPNTKCHKTHGPCTEKCISPTGPWDKCSLLYAAHRPIATLPTLKTVASYF